MDFALLCFDTLDEVEARLTDDDIDRYNLKHGLIAPSSSPLLVGAPPPPSSPLPQEPTATKNNSTSLVPTATDSSFSSFQLLPFITLHLHLHHLLLPAFFFLRYSKRHTFFFFRHSSSIFIWYCHCS
ncbi:hypothetical protein BCR33DRAFT_468198 [Rhizoclosmatium globosum]|uniref:Uncharacterized protein n=1 Tax=Rhizoclosmatium globosum TaxID=329046 RepID=A0A1Y2BQK2_9FUNG|nr:hypothetical protein BCR33DRAFT_468198 [Rhizoclosmatium globosum]|eukprot:ORY37014.1 hypothetical protein BCR33DRAFT_468198 [Rhizoclosmatium globosum]